MDSHSCWKEDGCRGGGIVNPKRGGERGATLLFEGVLIMGGESKDKDMMTESLGRREKRFGEDD